MSLVKVNIVDGVAEIILNRVEKMNALSAALIDELTAAAQDVGRRSKTENIYCALFGSATPKAFCAGADLGEREKMSPSEVLATLKKLRVLTKSVAEIPVPSIAAFEGIAFGGGLELALACDLRICAPTTQMGLTETRLGIIPGAGGTQRLSRLIGLAQAKELIFRAARISGNEALVLGLVNHCTDKPWELAKAWAKEMKDCGPLALRSAKRAIQVGFEKELESGLDIEHECYLEILNTADRSEGLKAFLEKRKPVYQGN